MELATLKQFALWLFWLFIVGMAFSWALSLTPIGRDDTDLDGRTMPGDILPMQFPRIATEKREG